MCDTWRIQFQQPVLEAWYSILSNWQIYDLFSEREGVNKDYRKLELKGIQHGGRKSPWIEQNGSMGIEGIEPQISN